MFATIVLVLFAITLIVILARTQAARDSQEEEARKWSNEYWLLRNSGAISEDYEVHLSFTHRGEHNCITKKDQKD